MRKKIALYLVRLLVGKTHHLAKNPAVGVTRKPRVKKDAVREYRGETPSGKGQVG